MPCGPPIHDSVQPSRPDRLINIEHVIGAIAARHQERRRIGSPARASRQNHVPNQRRRRVAANRSFSLANSVVGPRNGAFGVGPDRKSASTFPPILRRTRCSKTPCRRTARPPKSNGSSRRCRRQPCGRRSPQTHLPGEPERRAIPERVHIQNTRCEVSRIDRDPAVGPADRQPGSFDHRRRSVHRDENPKTKASF